MLDLMIRNRQVTSAVLAAALLLAGVAPSQTPQATSQAPVPASAKARDLVEVKLVFSCPDEAPSCMAQAGKSLGASKLIFGSVKKSAAGNTTSTSCG